MEVDYVSTQNNNQGQCLQCLTPEERKKLMDEGHCFRCRDKGHQSKVCPKKSQQEGQSQSSNARTTTTAPAPPVPSTSTNQADSPPAYMEDQLAGLIRSITTDQKENLLGKLALKTKGKETEVIDDREPEYDSNQDF